MENNRQQEQELTLKDLILKIQEYWSVLWKNKFKLIIAGLIGGLLMMASVWKSYEKYEAELSFSLNDEEGSGFSFGGVLGSIGLPGMAAGESNLEKILEFSKTRRIAQASIFERIQISGNEDFLANHIINNLDSLDLWERKKWLRSIDPKKSLKGFKFTQDSVPAFKSKDQSAFKRVYQRLNGSEDMSGIVQTDYNENTGIMYLKAKTSDPLLSIEICNTVFKSLSDFYIKQSIEKQEVTYNVVKEKTDSIKNALYGAQIQLAQFKDANRGLFKNRDNVKEVRLMGEVQKLTNMYAEAVKNLEMSDFAIKNKRPYITVIDAPMMPLQGLKKSKLKYLVLGGLLGGFLAALYYISKKIYSDAMNA